MRLRKLGRDGPEISVVGFGAWEAGGMGWGDNPPDDQTIAAMHAGIDAGMTWIDTAEVYGNGRSEELVGAVLRDRPEVLMFTKLAPEPAGSGFGADRVRRGAEASLARLGRDVIDLYQLHWRDDGTPVEETWEAMAGLVDDGLVRFIGVSNFDRDLIERCERIRHVDSLQSEFSMLRRKLVDVFEFCERSGTGVLCYGPLAYGLLTGTFTRDTTFPDGDWRSGKHRIEGYYRALFAPEVFGAHVDFAQTLKPIASGPGLTVAQLALAWVVQHRWCTGAIAGSRSPEHTRSNAAAGSVSLTPDDVARIESVL